MNASSLKTIKNDKYDLINKQTNKEGNDTKIDWSFFMLNFEVSLITRLPEYLLSPFLILNDILLAANFAVAPAGRQFFGRSKMSCSHCALCSFGVVVSQTRGSETREFCHKYLNVYRVFDERPVKVIVSLFVLTNCAHTF